MKKTKIASVVIDTNVYGWYLSYTLDGSRRNEAVNSYNLLSKILELKKPLVLGTDTIEREIRDAGRPELAQLFSSVVKGIIKKSRNIDELAKNYYDSCKKESLRLVTIDDCEIAAAAAMSGARILVTENRRTFNNPRVAKEIEKANVAKKIRSIKLMDSKNALGEIFA
ncbi:MAG: hypothetical protein J4400_00805 [Candidatus Aenigmarchaeota archaeon]|nr:hypothetical protein [Candidatus Aenigmarchaeota archaeon]